MIVDSEEAMKGLSLEKRNGEMREEMKMRVVLGYIRLGYWIIWVYSLVSLRMIFGPLRRVESKRY